MHFVYVHITVCVLSFEILNQKTDLVATLCVNVVSSMATLIFVLEKCGSCK